MADADADELYAAMDWLLAAGHLQRSLFDQLNLAEISSPDFPGERLVACFNPLLAEQRARRREELLRATEQELARLARQVAGRTKKPLKKEQIALKTGRVINRFKVAKHFQLSIEDGVFAWQRSATSISQESQLDGIYVIRTSQPQQELAAGDAVRGYKRLADVERAFRCLKSIELRVRPIYHRVDDRVRAHILLCMLAYYVQWHLKEAWAALLFQEEDLPALRAERDPVAAAEPSPTVQRKKATRQTPRGLPLQSFTTLLRQLATRCRNTCRPATDPDGATFHLLTQPTPLQAEAFRLLGL